MQIYSSTFFDWGFHKYLNFCSYFQAISNYIFMKWSCMLWADRQYHSENFILWSLLDKKNLFLKGWSKWKYSLILRKKTLLFAEKWKNILDTNKLKVGYQWKVKVDLGQFLESIKFIICGLSSCCRAMN